MLSLQGIVLGARVQLILKFKIILTVQGCTYSCLQPGMQNNSFLISLFHLKLAPNISCYQVPVVQRMDNAIHWVNHYPVDNNHLMTVLKGNIEICCPKTLGTLWLSLFTSQLKIEK